MLFAQELGPTIALVIMAVIFLSVAISFGLIGRSIFTPWLRAYMAGVQVMLLDIIGMRLRKVDVNAILDAMIMATHSGVEIKCRQMERAYLQGCNIETLTLAMIRAKQEEMDVTFEELVKADLEGRLSDKLESLQGRPSGEG